MVHFHESSGPEDGCRQAEGANVLLNFPLGLEMRDTRISLRSSHRAVNEMLNPHFLSHVSQVLALLYFPTRTYCKEILDAVDTIGVARRSFQGGWILQISLDEFNATVPRQFLGRVAFGVAGQRPQFPPLRPHVADHSSTLPSR